MTKKTSISGGILIGGGGRRMGGLDKSRLRLPSMQTFADRQHRLLSSHCEDVWFLGDPPASDPVDFEYRLSDSPGEYGPLAGIASGLRRVSERLLVIPCDLPFLGHRVLAQLVNTVESAPIYAATVNRMHPLVSVWHKSHLSAVVRGARESRSVRSVICDLNGQAIVFEAARDFFNVNTPEELTSVHVEWKKRY